MVTHTGVRGRTTRCLGSLSVLAMWGLADFTCKIVEIIYGISADFRRAAFFGAAGAGAVVVHTTGAEAGWHRRGS
jgi:hypothetical protein